MKSKEWDGSGIPPVGTVCEYKLNESEHWFKCEIKYVLEAGGDSFVAWCDHLDADQLLSFEAVNYQLFLRPIKTPEQIVVEERQRAIDKMMHLAVVPGRKYKDVMAYLYDAGYRKTEVKK